MRNQQRQKRETPTTILIQAYYEEVDHGEWDDQRVLRLCRFMNRCTPYELGALFCIKPATMKTWLERKKFPAYVSLHFRLLESWYFETIKKVKQKPVVPVQFLVT